ncbi:MAG TPA: sugar transferase, partial [Syntrophales bacterium]
PVFYRQNRVGYLGKTFTFWKFRTMHVDNDATGHQNYLSSLIHGDAPMLKLDADRDPRIIPCGRIIRQSCLDELPQFINVLLGDMSLVGPRPCLQYEADEYLAWHARRFDSVPGMTGLWQVNGKNKLTFKQMIRFDIQYARTMSPWLDVRILMRTIPAIVKMVAEHLAGKRAARAERVISGAPKRV